MIPAAFTVTESIISPSYSSTLTQLLPPKLPPFSCIVSLPILTQEPDSLAPREQREALEEVGGVSTNNNRQTLIIQLLVCLRSTNNSPYLITTERLFATNSELLARINSLQNLLIPQEWAHKKKRSLLLIWSIRIACISIMLSIVGSIYSKKQTENSQTIIEKLKSEQTVINKELQQQTVAEKKHRYSAKNSQITKLNQQLLRKLGKITKQLPNRTNKNPVIKIELDQDPDLALKKSLTTQ